jgi:hypothetical protein
VKINIKPKAERTVQRNLRLPISLNQQMDNTTALADELGIDYHATLIAAIEQFNIELDARLREMKDKGNGATSSGIIPGSESLPAPVAEYPPAIINAASTNPNNLLERPASPAALAPTVNGTDSRDRG